MAVYCPQWVYAACVGLTARDFLVKDIPIDLMARRYSKALLEKSKYKAQVEDIIDVSIKNVYQAPEVVKKEIVGYKAITELSCSR